MRIYVAGPYTAKREACEGCVHRWASLGDGSWMCNKHSVEIPGTNGGFHERHAGSPLSNCTEPDVVRRDSNVAAADAAGRVIARKGHTPFVPHKMTYDWERDQVLRYPDFIRIDDEWLRFCDALLYLAPSPGTDRELYLANVMELTIYFGVDEIPDLREAT